LLSLKANQQIFSSKDGSLPDNQRLSLQLTNISSIFCWFANKFIFLHVFYTEDIMKTAIKNTISYLLATIFLVTTSGFTVFEHHCTTENTSQFSFIIEDFNCEHPDHQHEHALPACCAENHGSKGDSCDDRNCCDTESYIVQLDITLEISKISKNTSPSLESGEPIYNLESPSKAKESRAIITYNDLPPPLSGKALHIFLQHLKIDCISV